MNLPSCHPKFLPEHLSLLSVLGLLLSWGAPVHAQDLALSAIVQPNSGCALSNAEPVSIRILNYGPTLPAGAAFLVAYWIDGGSSVNDTVTLSSNFQSNTSLVHTFAVPADLSSPGTHVLNAAINPTGDINPGNNTLTGYAVANSAPSLAGTLSGSVSNSGTLTLGASIGTVVQWEESPDLQRWFKLANTTQTQHYAGLTSPMHFRVRVANTPCAAVVSNVHTVTP